LTHPLAISFDLAELQFSETQMTVPGSQEAGSQSIEIFEPSTGGAGRHTYALSLRKADGSPAPGEDVAITMEGGGSLAPNFTSSEIHRETDAGGTARFTWYRRSIYGRDVRASLTVRATTPGLALAVEEMPAEASNTSYDLPGRSKWRF
jgi:hypothetical protein